MTVSAAQGAHEHESENGRARTMADVKHGVRPIVVNETPGLKAYCQCGLSAQLPYCDGTHSREQAGVRPLVVELVEACSKAICQCHQSSNRPWCDGTHSRLSSC